MKTKIILVVAILTATSLFAVVDHNNNSLSDLYEFIYFGGPTYPFAGPDGDGVTTYDEMFWGTNPTNAASKVTGPTATRNGNTVQFTWPAAPNRFYTLEASVDLLTWQTVTNGAVAGFTQPLGGANPAARFYRLSVSLLSTDTNGDGVADWEEALWQQTYGQPMSLTDIDGDGLPDLQEFQQGHDPGKKDHPAVGLVLFTPLEK
jgi:hypothetical protein